jgi:hypothetical protein
VFTWTAQAAVDDLVAFVRQHLDEDERVVNGSCLHIDDCNGSGFGDRFDDDRLLAEVEAKRRILDLCAPEVDDGTSGARIARLTIHMLAQPYAGREGWREEWRA